jgi:hypothetical protein
VQPVRFLPLPRPHFASFAAVARYIVMLELLYLHTRCIVPRKTLYYLVCPRSLLFHKLKYSPVASSLNTLAPS